MGRLSAEWAGRIITMRKPYEMAGEAIMTASESGTQINNALFTNNVDLPFEVHRMKPNVTALNDAGVALATQPSQDLMQSLVRLRMEDFGKLGAFIKNPTLLTLLTKGSSERTWEWAEPYFITRSEGFQVSLDTLAFPVFDGNQIPVDPATNPLVSLRIEIAFQGFLCVVAPPSNTR